MIIPCYLALTAAEFANTDTLPENCAYMACHFSCYGDGLSNLPESLPSGAILILNDRTPIYRHDPKRILSQLEAFVAENDLSGILLDFQRPGVPLTGEVARTLTQSLHCPVAVTPAYGKGLSCPLFLPPPPLHIPLKDHIAPYGDRELWLELAPETMRYIVGKENCVTEEMDHPPLPEPYLTEKASFCRYHIKIKEDRAEFILQRTESELRDMLLAECSISRAVGLYQQLKKMPTG